MSGIAPSLVWFRRDLRTSDNPALARAVARGGPVVPVYIWNPEDEGGWTPGAASRWWLHHSLLALEAALARLGGRLIVRRGPALATLTALAKECGAAAVYWNRLYEAAAVERDRSIKASLIQSGLVAEDHSGGLLFEPWEVATRAGRPFQVFTAFWKACLSTGELTVPLPPPVHLPPPQRWPASLHVQQLELLPTKSWIAGLAANWQPGESSALQRLQSFIEGGVKDYSDGRDRPDLDGTAKLSPHLHLGELSARQAWHAVRDADLRQQPTNATGQIDAFLRQLGWREFAHHLLFHFPHTTERPLRREFESFPWKSNTEYLAAWQQGRTGYPIVDAGMRQLWETGWMHNRVRMIVASFLVKDLLIPWNDGAAWFWDTLVDADLANNTLGWQWSAGCGADAAPYFRVFNPGLQAEKFDPNGAYVRRYVQELAQLPAPWIHRPWEADSMMLSEAGVGLGTTYPDRIVDHAEARREALAAFARSKQ